jgi:phage gp36-like protein
MFVEPEELTTAIHEYQLANIATTAQIRMALMAAIDEAKGYLHGRYDTRAIFAATGDDRHITLVEHIKNLAVWYVCRRANTDMIYEQVKEYRAAAIDWLEKVAGVKGTEKPLAPDLPLLTGEDGAVRTTIRTGSRQKFHHDW